MTLLIQINVDRGRCSMRHWFLWARLLIAYFRPKGAWNLHLSLFCWIISIKLCLKIRKRRKTEGTSYQIKEVNYHRRKLERKKSLLYWISLFRENSARFLEININRERNTTILINGYTWFCIIKWIRDKYWLCVHKLVIWWSWQWWCWSPN